MFAVVVDGRALDALPQGVASPQYVVFLEQARLQLCLSVRQRERDHITHHKVTHPIFRHPPSFCLFPDPVAVHCDITVAVLCHLQVLQTKPSGSCGMP